MTQMSKAKDMALMDVARAALRHDDVVQTAKRAHTTEKHLYSDEQRQSLLVEIENVTAAFHAARAAYEAIP